MVNKIFVRPAYFIKFVQEEDNFYAISEFEPYKGQIIEELLWANILPGNIVIWEDDWKNKVPCETFSKAERYIRENYLSHAPTLLGSRYNIKK